MTSNELFEEIIEYPSPEKEKRYLELIGLDDIKTTLHKEVNILLNPELLPQWSKKNYKKEIKLLDFFKNRFPFFIFAGDVGTGKTTLAESFGDIIAREEKMSLYLYRLSLKTRGTGAVGEMTRLISGAFEEVKKIAQRGRRKDKKPDSAVILLIDEADALAQSRELAQMHHEDRAGVNALIRGIDTLANSDLPVIVLMCTNRYDSIDPAIKRRAVDVFIFDRPNDEQRKFILKSSLVDADIKEEDINELAVLIGPSIESKRGYGYTYSDIIQKLLPRILINAYPDKKINMIDIKSIIKETPPTPPFLETN